jgi:hypothetical protein
MRKELKMIFGGAVLCVLGALALDCGIRNTGLMLICLGLFGIIFGPLAVSL